MGKLYTDRVDVDTQISLYEYGIIRNPKTGRTILCHNSYDLNITFPEDGPFKPDLTVEYFYIEDVEEALNDCPDGFFSFIGSDLQTELSMLDNDNLAHTIQSLMQYGGNCLSDRILMG